jgi:hypothetical protein
MTDAIWDAFVDRALSLGATREQRSRYADKPALWLGSREIAHCETAGTIDVRITAAGWRSARARFGTDPAVTKVAARRDWLELRLTNPADLDRYADLIAHTIQSNR